MQSMKIVFKYFADDRKPWHMYLAKADGTADVFIEHFYNCSTVQNFFDLDVERDSGKEIVRNVFCERE